MNTQQLKWIPILALAALATTNQASGASLKIGDPAPKLQVGKWVQGEPVKSFEPGTAYIVEFWATWCGPCRVSIPHLNDIHNKFKDKGLVVIGQDCWENDESQVEPFIKKMGDKMTYRVALDDKQDNEKGKMAETWMAAAGRNGIPSAFLVTKEAKIAWIGHPMQLQESTIQAVLDGKFDVAKAAADYDLQEKNQAQIMTLSRQLNRNMQAKEWDKADSTLNEIEKLLPEDQRVGISATRLNILLEKGDEQAAAKLASELSDAQKDNAMLQNQLAWTLAAKPGLKDRQLDLAEKIALRANDASKGKDPQILDTLARVTFLQGKKDKAIELQEKAIKLAERPLKENLEKTLESYKAGKAPAEE